MSRRAHLEASAARGSETARLALLGPEFPDAFGYLRDWIYQVHGRSGVGQTGVAPLSYGTIADWARLRDVRLAPYEVDALMQLDAVLLNPETDEKAPAAEKPADRAAWPTRKGEG